jgi:hypothetical protein
MIIDASVVEDLGTELEKSRSATDQSSPQRNPKHLCGWCWSTEPISNIVPTSSTVSLLADPFPAIPENVRNNLELQKTITAYPEKFKIITPIRVTTLWLLLKDHPNQDLVLSAC